MHHFGLSAQAAIIAAILFVAIGACQSKNRTQEKLGSLLFDGAAFGPLFLLFASPFAEYVGVHTDLVEEVMRSEAIWPAVTYAGFMLLSKLR